MRVVSMVPSWTETLIECGVNVVGRTRFCIHPKEKVKSVEVVGGTKDIKWEKVKALDPDLMIFDREENPESMASESPYPYYASHIRSIGDVSQDLEGMADEIGSNRLRDLARRWSTVADRKRQPCGSLENIPGMVEWVKKPGPKIDRFAYIIWKDPWMAVSKDTFIGSIFEWLGFGDMMMNFDKSYPEIPLEKLDPERTLLLFSTEPFPFLKQKKAIEKLPFAMGIVDGEPYSWFGVRSVKFLENMPKV